MYEPASGSPGSTCIFSRSSSSMHPDRGTPFCKTLAHMRQGSILRICVRYLAQMRQCSRRARRVAGAGCSAIKYQSDTHLLFKNCETVCQETTAGPDRECTTSTAPLSGGHTPSLQTPSETHTFCPGFFCETHFLCRKVQWFGGGLVSEAHRRLYHSA